MKRMLCAASAMLLLSGCGANLSRYPWVEPQSNPLPAPMTITLTLPTDTDDILSDTMILLEAKLKELSGEQTTLETVRSDSIVQSYRSGGAGLYLLTSGQMAELDDRLRYTQMPYLFQNQEKLFAHLNSDQGTIRQSPVTAQRLGGEVVGVYYGGAAWMLSRAQFYDDVGFYNTVGALKEMAGNDAFVAIGGEQVTEGSADEILAAFVREEVKFCELLPGAELSAEVQAVAKRIEPTDHRFLGWWMVLKNPNESYGAQSVQMIHEAFAYTLEQQNSQRQLLETQQQQWLNETYRIESGEPEEYATTRTRARKYYQENRETLGIPDDIWSEIRGVIE